eukprot:gnl/Hemi2/465_TR158_c0_g1_i1.p1 gnl/Hemi2/465_TR158_c0_g1~~gnl/Hemi2/465_TR158_c0_g1_i1.p1  ORF type:complete len:204 (+),score=63.13 gnl/Hemi2/465_TR158_c0_g1_i1:108-719(+)
MFQRTVTANLKTIHSSRELHRVASSHGLPRTISTRSNVSYGSHATHHSSAADEKAAATFSRKQRLISLSQVKKNLQFIYVTLMFCGVFLICNLVDTVYYYGVRAQGLPWQWRSSLLTMHVIACFAALIGFIHAIESLDRDSRLYGGVALALNFVLFLWRISMEFALHEWSTETIAMSDGTNPDVSDSSLTGLQWGGGPPTNAP